VGIFNGKSFGAMEEAPLSLTFNDSINGTGFLTETTIDALGHVDIFFTLRELSGDRYEGY
jgi:hypothetical protein